ncbi:hypothetical protein [Streptomyces sp. NPDC018059]|uniref:hypothetical protein n=1 Tax=Streptomyces sp. NPDC018059 TaxID=3365041 RepID=UPI00378BC6EA
MDYDAADQLTSATTSTTTTAYAYDPLGLFGDSSNQSHCTGCTDETGEPSGRLPVMTAINRHGLPSPFMRHGARLEWRVRSLTDKAERSGSPTLKRGSARVELVTQRVPPPWHSAA